MHLLLQGDRMAETRTPSSWTLHLQTANDYGVWTGGAAPDKMDSLKTTSFTGGLRFWTDALLRAEGRECCTGQSRCSYGGGGKPVCPTCAIFGFPGPSRSAQKRLISPMPPRGANKQSICTNLSTTIARAGKKLQSITGQRATAGQLRSAYPCAGPIIDPSHFPPKC